MNTMVPLFHIRSWIMWFVFTIVLTAYLLVFFFVTHVAWPSLLLSIVLTVYAYGIWICALNRIVHNDEYVAPPSPLIPLFDMIALFLITVIHNMALYAAVALMAPDSYLGIEVPSGDLARWRVLWLSFYLAMDTTVIAGSGGVNPNAASNALVGFIPVVFNYIQGMLFYTVIGWGTVYMIQRYGKERGKRTERFISQKTSVKNK
ncbi:MAG: hypothetical protein ACTSUE_05680 [Promethearchaeota archaeon]